MSKFTKILDVCDTMREGEHYKIFGTAKSFRTKGLLFTLKFENGCLSAERVLDIKTFTEECQDLQYYAMCVTGSDIAKNLQMVLKVVTKAICGVAAIKKLYKPVVDGGIGSCSLTIKAVPKHVLPVTTVAMHLGMAFKKSILYSDGLSISQDDYNNGTTAWTNLFRVGLMYIVDGEEYEDDTIKERFHALLKAQAHSNERNARLGGRITKSYLTRQIYQLKGRIETKNRTISGLKCKFQTLKQESKGKITRANKEIGRLKQLLLKRQREPEVFETKPSSSKKSKYGDADWYTDGFHECEECEGCGLDSRHDYAQGKDVQFQEM